MTAALWLLVFEAGVRVAFAAADAGKRLAATVAALRGAW